MGYTISVPVGTMEGGSNSPSRMLFPADECAQGVDSGALFSALYMELHRLARRELARRMAPVSLSVTTLLHEAYIDMSACVAASFPDQARFMGYAARVMRGIIIDHARRGSAIKRGREFEITSLTSDSIAKPACAEELTAISEALDRLALAEPELAQVVDLKFFCGFSLAEIAAMYNLSARTVQRRWEKARIYLRRSLCGEGTVDTCVR